MTEPSALSIALSNALIGLLAIAVPTLSTFLALALNRLKAKWALEATAQDKANMDVELRASAAVGVAKVAPLENLTTATHDEAVSQAADYFQQRFPDRTATITAAANATTPGEIKAAVSEMIAGRLPEVVPAAAKGELK